MKRTTAVKASVFPRRLSRSDEGRLAKRIKHGHLEAKERMIESNLVLRACHRTTAPCVSTG